MIKDLSSKTALVVGNGTPPTLEFLCRFWDSVALRVAADGGANSLLELGLRPDVVVGDLDSLSDTSRAQFSDAQLYRVYDQETNDVTKVLQYSVDHGMRQVHLFGMFGSRTDHFLACLDACYGFREQLQLTIWRETERLDLVTDCWNSTLARGTIISLLPVFGKVEGVQTQGLQYALANQELSPGIPPCGVSNVVSASEVEISIRCGCLLVLTQLEQD